MKDSGEYLYRGASGNAGLPGDKEPGFRNVRAAALPSSGSARRTAVLPVKAPQ